MKRWIDDVLLAVGFGFMIHGAYLIYIPAGYILLGLCLVIQAVLVAKK